MKKFAILLVVPMLVLAGCGNSEEYDRSYAEIEAFYEASSDILQQAMCEEYEELGVQEDAHHTEFEDWSAVEDFFDEVC